MLSVRMDRADGPVKRLDVPRSRQSALVVRTVRTHVESVRVPSFLRELLAKPRN
jgi:hypothetical protein